ncbi:MAG TPA: DUF1844 domain-containing protein [Chthoniobacterales bacterium]
MAEYQHTVTSAGEMTQRFIEFVLMHAQNAAFMLGQIPHPQTGKPEVNLEMAQLLIDQLVMIQQKTAGNLNSDEARILNGTLSNLQLAFVEAARNPVGEASGRGDVSEMAPATDPVRPAVPEAATNPAPAPAPEGQSRKKFVKSYGS